MPPLVAVKNPDHTHPCWRAQGRAAELWQQRREGHTHEMNLEMWRTCLPKWKSDMSQQPCLFCWHCSRLCSPYLPTSFSLFKSFFLMSSKHLTCVHFLTLLPLSLSLSFRLWCWRIQILRVVCLSALMREPVTRSTASLSTSWASYFTPPRRTGP